MKTTLIRTQIQLTPQQMSGLQQLAVKRKVSMAELVRQGVDHILQEADRERAKQIERALAAVGRFQSDASDVSTRHDDYFVEAIMDRTE